MKALSKIIFRQFTLFSVMGVAAIAIGLPLGLYMLTRSGYDVLGGYYLLLGVAVMTVLLIIDRVAVRHVTTGKLSAIEGVLFVLFIAFLNYQGRRTTLKIPEGTAYYFLIENDGSLENSDLAYAFPFNKQLVNEGKVGVMPEGSKALRRLAVETPDDWGGYKMSARKFGSMTVRYYTRPDAPAIDGSILDSLVVAAIAAIKDSS